MRECAFRPWACGVVALTVWFAVDNQRRFPHPHADRHIVGYDLLKSSLLALADDFAGPYRQASSRLAMRSRRQ